MAFFELDDVFTYQDANDIKKLWAGDTAPTSPGTGEVWLDTSTTPNQLKRYNGSGWDTIGELTAGDLLNLIKTVDGSGSGLDADMLDGQEGSYYRNADNLNAGTVPLARIPTTLTGKDADKLDGQEGSYYRNASNLNAGTVPQARLSASDLLTLIKTVDGSGSGLDADKLDTQEGSFYRDASNLNSGTIPSARLSASDLLTLIKTVDGSGSGLNADKLDGQEGSFYRNADNLNSGSVSRARLSELADVANPYICAGKTNVTQQWQIIYFPTAYTNAPKVVTTVDEAGRIARVTSITTIQFQVQREKANYPDFSFDGGYIYWIAYGNKA